MHKEELIQLHTYMAQMKRYFERHGVTHEFDDYKALSISPVHIHRSPQSQARNFHFRRRACDPHVPG